MAIFLIAVFLRLYNFSDTTAFSGDQGIDLLVARRALIDGVWPKVGPYLTVQNFFVPPTYYYLLTMFLAFGKIPLGAALFFPVLDVITLVIVFFFMRDLLDELGGLIAVALYAFSAIMITHARSMWQPHPVQVFLWGSLYALFLARRKNNIKLLLLSVFLYALAVSVYPSPILLLFFYLAHVVGFFRHARGYGVMPALSHSILVLLVCFLIVGFPMGVYEYQHKFPMLLAMRSSSFGLPSIAGALNHIGVGLFWFFSGTFSLGVLFERNYEPFVSLYAIVFVVAVLVVYTKNREVNSSYRNVFSYTKISLLIVGFMSSVFFLDMVKNEWAWHRLYSFLPFLFILLTVTIRFAFDFRQYWYRVMIGVFAFLYFLSNSLVSYRRWFKNTNGVNQFGKAEQVARYIDGFAHEKDLRNDMFVVLGYLPGDSGNYIVTPELYFLQEIRNFPIQFNEAGNDIKREELNFVQTSYKFLVCKQFSKIEEIFSGCVGTFRKRHPAYRQVRHRLFFDNTVVFTFQKI